MTPEQFCYWLQGLMEVGKPTSLSEEQTQQVKDHLALVFEKVTLERSRRTPAEDVALALRRRVLPIARDHTHLEHVKFC
jgi:hypothetical protein